MIVVDIETGGLVREIHPIVSLGMIHYESGDEFYRQVRLDFGVISEWSQKNLNLDFTQGQSMLQIETEAIEWLNRRSVVQGQSWGILGHNVHYERRWFRKWMPKLDTYFRHRHEDTAVLAHALVRANRIPAYKNLQHLCKSFDIELKPHHALADCHATRQLYQKLIALIAQV